MLRLKKENRVLKDKLNRLEQLEARITTLEAHTLKSH